MDPLRFSWLVTVVLTVKPAVCVCAGTEATTAGTTCTTLRGGRCCTMWQQWVWSTTGSCTASASTSATTTTSWASASTHWRTTLLQDRCTNTHVHCLRLLDWQVKACSVGLFQCLYNWFWTGSVTGWFKYKWGPNVSSGLIIWQVLISI